MTVAEMFAEGLVAALKLEPGKRYILVFDALALPVSIASEMTKVLHEVWEVEAMSVRVFGKPADAIRGIEIEEAPGLRPHQDIRGG